MGFIKTAGLLALSAALFGSAYSHQEPCASSDIQLHVFENCNDWWLAVDPRGDGDETVRVELQEGGSSAWTELIHTPSWGYFHIVSHDRRGFDLPLSFRLTSSEGDQVTVGNLTSVDPGSDIDTGASWAHQNSTQAPTEAPTDGPTGAPTEAPTGAPTDAPTDAPTNAPTDAPTQAPTDAPTQAPTDAPTQAPTDAPTQAPTDAPTQAPTDAPTHAPTQAPTDAPTQAPTSAPAVTTGRPATTGRPTTGRPATTGSSSAATTSSSAATTSSSASTSTSGTVATSTSGSSSGSTDLCAVPPTSSEPLKILVPLYSYPGSAWDNVVSAASSGAKIIAIINPSSGPIASGPDSTWTSYMNKLTSAGVDMIGYIHTSYGTRSVSDVMAEVDTYASKYSGLKGVFLDEVSADASELSYYSQVYQHINGKSGFSNTILNPGAQPDQGYLDVSTSIVIFESPASSLKSSYASWVKCAPSAAAKAGYKYKFAGIAYGAGSGEISSVISTMQNAGMGLVYVTDGAGGCCTYNTLASYFASEASTVAALN